MKLIDLFLKGGVMMYPILLCSVAAVGIILERLIYIVSASSRNKKFIDLGVKIDINSPDRQGRLLSLAKEIQCPVSAIIETAITNLDKPGAQRNIVVQREGSRQRRDLEKFVNTLGVIARISPLLGLLGTVLGMIKAFMTIQVLGGQVDATDLAGGIWEAMITTAAGLFVAIPTLFFYHFIEGWIDEIIAGIKDCAVTFPDILGTYNLMATPGKHAADPSVKEN